MSVPDRNDPCPCGSGKKYKKCCMPLAASQLSISRQDTHTTSKHLSVNQLLQQGLAEQQAGRLQGAGELYQAVLQVDPKNSDALHLLGLVSHKLGQHETAVELINRALRINPQAQIFYCNLGSAYLSLGKSGDAAKAFKSAIKLDPSHAESYYNLGLACKTLNQPDEAFVCYRKALQIKPDYAEAHNNLGVLLKDQEKLDEAAFSLSQALEFKPDFAEAYCNLGLVCEMSGKLENAVTYLLRACELKPDFASAYVILGNVCKKQDKLPEAEACLKQALEIEPGLIEAMFNLGEVFRLQKKLEQGVACLNYVLKLKPDLVEAHINLGVILMDQGKQDEAVASQQQALKLDPQQVDAYHNMSMAFREQGKLDEARICGEAAIKLKPDYAEAYSNLGGVLIGQGKLEEAAVCITRALELKPDFVGAHSSLIFAQDMLDGVTTEGMQAERKRWDTAHAAQLLDTRAHGNSVHPNRRLRIGYVSGDFRMHSAAHVFGSMLVNYDREQFDVYAYSNFTREDAFTRLFHQNVTHWKNIAGLSDGVVAELIRQDGIDILVDLSGHSAENRLLIFARKPAPVQITAWGYATGTGMRAMDAFLADPIAVPQDEKQYYTEDVRYLPSIVNYFNPQPFPSINALPALSNQAITFGSCNRLAKISEQAYATWAQVLQAVPGSRMLLKTGELDDPGARAGVLERFTRSGIAAERIILLGSTSWDEHVATFNQIDIALDPFPHCGGVTALEGLMMGVPMVTLQWHTLVGRLSASMLHTLELTDWIAQTPEQYIEIAVQKSRNLQALSQLRQELRDKFSASVIGDTQAYARAVEQEYRTLWQEWCGRQKVQQDQASDLQGMAASVMVPGRNDLCPCGSGKKYKQCCLTDDATQKQSERSRTTEKNINISAAIETAVQHHQAGRYAEAAAGYKQVLDIESTHPDALHLSGLLAHQNGDNETAVYLIGRAIHASPKEYIFYCNLGAAYLGMGNVDNAIEVLRMGIKLNPNYAELHYNLGLALTRLGRLNAAVASYQRTLALRPEYAEAYNNLGLILKDQGALEEAIGCYRKALALKPDFAEAYGNIGNVLIEQGRVEDALTCVRQALEINPHYVEGHNNLGRMLHDMGRWEEAANCLHQALMLKPDFIEAHTNLGNVLKDQGKLNEAVASHQQALILKPNFPEAHYNLGNAFKAWNKLSEAVVSYRQALALKPDFPEAHNNLGITFTIQGRLVNATDCYRTALSIRPAYSEAHSSLIFAQDMLDGVTTEGMQAERKRWDTAHAAQLLDTRAHGNSVHPNRRLRIGYVSGDFRMHSAAHVFGSMLVNYDREQFDVYAYSNFTREDAFTRLFHQNVTHWKNIAGLSDGVVAELIRQDGIDILVDLSGHSAENRLLIFARKPAPVQITAWGYATGTGMRAMDAFLADPIAVPQDEKQYYTEDVRYLPSIVNYFNPQPFPSINALPALSNQAITFGSCNRLAKISEQAYATWAQVLQAVPGSRMLLKTGELDDPGARAGVLERFTRSGIAAERIILLGSTSWDEHVATFNQIDIALDPFPHCGGVTALEGLMMGVPMVTLQWHTLVGRLSASMLHTLELTDWIAQTPEQYIEIAVQKSRNLQALSQLRQELRDKFSASVIGDTQAYARAVEQEYRTLWQEWCGQRKRDE